ncbi:hypothetical protein DNTS_027526 [Danionella cerebrum]|uniref:Phosphatidylinositol 3,4,5-trisphosphate 5-phosphatase 1/2-like second C2 domain-containing protein n=1 Tax=Danionella cerebrum TaxID=2873325 RepID=A0A553R2P4_9TELE|nr:hypothetical protein DNTS_027526 [Danionella translucida]
MSSDHSPVFATFDVGVTSQFVSKNDLSKDAQGAIKVMNCLAELFTKAKTKFFIEFHSSCLEKFVKSPEGENQECTNGEIWVRFVRQVELTPIIADPEYLLDEHILICIKSSDSDESYDFIKIGDDPGACKAKPGEKNKMPSSVLPTDISNPSYMGIGYKNSNPIDRGQRTAASSGHSKDMKHGNISPKKTSFDPTTSSPTVKTSNTGSLDDDPPEMFDNPLYGSTCGSRGAKDPLSAPDAHFSFLKKADSDADRHLPQPNPRFRSFTYSETSKQASQPTNPSQSTIHSENTSKKPALPSRSEGGTGGPSRPPIPIKSHPAQTPEPRDYRDSSELPSKTRGQSRPSQAKDVQHKAPAPLKLGRSLK